MSPVPPLFGKMHDLPLACFGWGIVAGQLAQLAEAEAAAAPAAR